MTRSESSQTVLQQSIEEQQCANLRGRYAKVHTTSSDALISTATLSGYKILASSRPSSRERNYSSSQPAPDALLYKAREVSDQMPPMQPHHSSIDIAHRASSKISTTSSKSSSGGESSKELLQDYGDEEATPLIPEAHGVRVGSNRKTSLRSLMTNGQQLALLPRLETSNSLTSDEKMEQLKRSQKLDNMLGEEWRRESEHSWSRTVESAGIRSPTVSPVEKRMGLLRRQSDPLVLRYATGAGTSEEEMKGESAVQAGGYQAGAARNLSTARWRGLHSNRSRSSLNLRHDAVSSKADTPIPHTIPPLDIHPKAAALLGLCVLPEQLFVVQQLRLNQQQDVSPLTHSRPDSSCSRVEGWRDSEPPTGKEYRLRQGTEDVALPHVSGDQRMGNAASSTYRSERRRRVRKISRWLGAAVPPHLVKPNLDQQQRTMSASGYNLDEAPPSPFADYMSGSPLHQRGGGDDVAGSTSRPLVKAKGMMHAKLAKKPIHTATTSQSEADCCRLPLSEQDRASNVKRNHKLTSVFGQAPPQDLLLGGAPAASTAVTIHGRSGDWSRRRPKEPREGSLSPSKRQSPSNPPDTFSLQPLHHHSESSDNEAASSDSARLERISRQQYRASIESLEYLVEKDPPLLDELVTAFAEEEVRSRRSRRLQADSSSSSPVLAQDDDVTFIGSVDSCEEAGATSLDVGDGNRSRTRELKIRRHQKLGRWFGEKINDENVCPGEEAAPSSSASQYSDLPSKRSSSTRMAPRSAGSAQRPHSLHHRRAFHKILNSLEAEVTEDDALSEREKEQLQERLWRLQKLESVQTGSP